MDNLDIHVVQGDMLSCGAEAIINPSNCVGAMGKGLAATIRDAFPGCEAEFKKVCASGALEPGVILPFHTRRTTPRLVFHLPTKRHWRDKSRLEDVIAGLASLPEACKHFRVRSLAIPALGCGLGGLDWEVVAPHIFSHALDCGLRELWMFAPDGWQS